MDAATLPAGRDPEEDQREKEREAMRRLPVMCWAEDCGKWAKTGSDYCEEHDDGRTAVERGDA